MKHIYIYSVLLALSLFGCSDGDTLLPDLPPDTLERTAATALKGKGSMQNPYEIGTFRAAYERALEKANEEAVRAGKPLKGVKKSTASAIAPNYLYIRFDPKNDGQENILRQHPEMVLIDYPFEHEDGERYHRENPLKEGQRPSYYTSIPIDMAYPKKVPHTILQRMYIPERDSRYNGETEGTSGDDISVMEGAIERAYVGTGKGPLAGATPQEVSGNQFQGQVEPQWEHHDMGRQPRGRPA